MTVAARRRHTGLALGAFTGISAVISIASLFVSAFNWMIRASIFLIVVALAIFGARHWPIIQKRFNAADQWIRVGRGFRPLVATIACISLILFGAGVYSEGRNKSAGAAAVNVDRSRSRRLLWSFNTDYVVNAGPTVAGATVYAGSIDEIYALNASNGHRRWIYHTAVWSGEGPAVGDGSLYIGCTGMLCAINSVTGLLRWTSVPGCPLFSTPAVAGSMVYVGCSNHKEYALAATTGQVRWTYHAASSLISTPQVMGGNLYVASRGGSVYCLDAATGQLRWVRAVGSLPSISVAGGMLYAGSYDNTVTALNVVNGDRLWQFKADGPVQARPVIVSSTVYFGSTDRVYAVNAATGRSRWVQAVGYGVDSGAAVADNTVFIASGDQLYALNATDGQSRWSYIIGTPNVDYNTNPVTEGSRVFMGADGVYALNAASS